MNERTKSLRGVFGVGARVGCANMIDSHPPRALDCGLSTHPGVYRKENNTLELEVALKIVCAGDWIAVVHEKRLKAAAARQSVSNCDGGGAESVGEKWKTESLSAMP